MAALFVRKGVTNQGNIHIGLYGEGKKGKQFVDRILKGDNGNAGNFKRLTKSIGITGLAEDKVP